MPNDFWTEERTQALKDLVAAGLYSRSQMSALLTAQFGAECSRNAVIGKINRLGIGYHRERAPKGPQQVRKPRVKRERVPVLKVIAANGNSNTLKLIETTQFKEMPTLRCVHVEPLNVSLDDIAPKGCRYPSGGEGPNHLFCGHPSLPGFSYCGPHKALCFGPGSSGERAAHKISRRHLEGAA